MTAGKTLSLTGLANGATVNLLGDVTFGVKYVHDDDDDG
jgi:polygalacturonase